MEALIMAAQLLLGISILVGLHEMGHLVAAKIFGMRVEKFSIGFPPKIFGVQYGETEYSIGAIPLGGFVKISGMVDESMDTAQLAEEPKEYEFRSKPAWQRLIVMMGGIIVNVVTGIIIFVVMIYSNGESYVATSEVNKLGIVPSKLGQELGLKTGDRIVKINGHNYESYTDIWGPDVLLNNNSYYTVQRNDETIRLDVPNDFISKISDQKRFEEFVTPIVTFKVGEVAKDMGAEKAGIKQGDKIIEAAGQPIQYFHEFHEVLAANKNEDIKLKLLRNQDTVATNAKVNEEGILGFSVNRDIKINTKEFTLAQSIPKGTNRAFDVVYSNIKGFGKIFRGDISPSKAISGPIGIAKIFGGTWDWTRFWYLVGLLSMVLAFMNFLPIPALDGGHVMFLMYEMVSGRKPSDKFLEYSTKVGMVLLLGLMAFAFLNDIFKEIF